MGKVCKKCGYTRKPQDTAPAYECPNCGAVYEKVEAQLARKATGSGAPQNPPRARRIDFKAGPVFRRGVHILLLVVSWILGLSGIVNLLAGDFNNGGQTTFFDANNGGPNNGGQTTFFDVPRS
jgi:hypothetical protein